MTTNAFARAEGVLIGALIGAEATRRTIDSCVRLGQRFAPLAPLVPLLSKPTVVTLLHDWPLLDG